MPKPQNAMEIFKLLDKSNCRVCNEKTCLAFSGAVYTGRRHLSECPKLDEQVIAMFSDDQMDSGDMEQNRNEYIESLKQRIGSADLKALAEQTGGRYENDRLIIKVMGKDFSVNSNGSISTDIHVNSWIVVPFLHYVLDGMGLIPTGNWRSFRELQDGRERYPLFQKRCEEPMKQVADRYPDLFDDMVRLFNGRQVDPVFKSDISVILHPLPRLPIMICYWMSEERMASSLNVFFDQTADRNLDNGSIFSLGAGLSLMFERLAQRHGFTSTVS
ncbi:MAG: DUF3786 domain-containing protein [Desulfatirhabdiaceae bacterium]